MYIVIIVIVCNMLDAILYINLEHRTDRRDHVLKEIRKICKDDAKIHRIDAIRDAIGIRGCGLSHIKSLKYILEHPEWKHCLVLEDDFTFQSDDEADIRGKLDMFFNDFKEFDVCVMSHNLLKSVDTHNDLIKKVIYSQTASSYILNTQFVPTLLHNFEESSNDMRLRGKRHTNCVDIHWSVLQPVSRWFAFDPRLGHQYDSYSDIENRFMSYNV